MLPAQTGRIGTITTKITKQTGYDEIKFFIPVTNISSVEQCFIVKLCDASGKVIDREPPSITRVWANRILPGKTETMIIDSEWQLWNIHDVAGQIISFKLVADPTGWLDHCSILDSSYNIVDTKTKAMPVYGEDPSIVEEAEGFMKTLTILIVVILIARLAAEFR